jgi:hypothetical protein
MKLDTVAANLRPTTAAYEYTVGLLKDRQGTLVIVKLTVLVCRTLHVVRVE